MKRIGLPLAACRGCRRPIVFADLADGTRVPLEPRAAAAYRITDKASSHVLAERVEGLHVSHFLTCPNRDQFSGRGRRRATRAGNSPEEAGGAPGQEVL